MILPVLLLACCLTAPSPETVRLEPLPDEMVVRIDDVLRLSSRFLIEQQEEDGSWRSRTYGILKDDLALTPFVLSALHNMPNGGGTAQASLDKGVEFLLADPGWLSAAHGGRGNRRMRLPGSNSPLPAC